MATVPVTAHTGFGGGGGLGHLWHRELRSYPNNGYRMVLLAMVVLANIMFTWSVSAGAAATPVIFVHYGMTLGYYSDLLVVAGVIGGLASYISSFGDRWGRANMVVAGLLINGVFALVALPGSPNKTIYSVFLCLLYLADGAIFVSTPALVRDFSPQMQRGLAMGFWTFGPVAGSFVISLVAHATLPLKPGFSDWQTLYRYAGVGALVMFVVCFFFLRELSPELRSQRMASVTERALVEARARGIDLAATMEHRWRQILHVNTVVSPIAINLFLVIYFTAISYFVFYFSEFLKFPLSTFNGLQEIYWGVNIVMLVVAGALSDRLRVRKPFMAVGAVGAIVMIVILMKAKPGSSYTEMALILSLLASFLAITYCPWFASFTETLEAHNPALIATGTSLYGFSTRLVLVPFGVIIPHVLGSPVQTLAGWHDWFYVCIGGIVVFTPLIFTMVGRWSPAKARADFEAHEALVERELAALGQAEGHRAPVAPGVVTA
jgi:MFS family permease